MATTVSASQATRRKAAKNSLETKRPETVKKAPLPRAASATKISKPVPVAVVVETVVPEIKRKHPKLVRDSFTIPKSEYAVLDALKLRAIALSQPAKKGELIRGGIAALAAMSDKAFLATLASVPSLKTGRPGKTMRGID